MLITSHQGNVNQKHNEGPLCIFDGYHEKRQTVARVSKDVGRLELYILLLQMENRHSLWKTDWQFLERLNLVTV